MRSRPVLLIAVLATMLARAAPAAAAIRVKLHDDGAVLASFKSLRCKVTKKGFTATGRAGKWKLTARIYSFSGYHTYVVDYGSEGNADFFITGDIKTTYSNIGKPDTGGLVELTKGGSYAFPGGPAKFGIGFPLAYRLGEFHEQVSVVGTASCSRRS